MNNFYKLALFLCAFIPLYFLIIIKTLVDIIFGNMRFNILNSTMLALMLILISLGLTGFFICLNKKHDYSKIKIISATNITDQHFLNYFSLFVLFAITFDLSKVSYSLVFLIVLIFIGRVYIKNELFYINPFFNIMGFEFYEITFEKENSTTTENGRVFCKQKLNPCSNYINATKTSQNLWFIDMRGCK